MIPNDGKISGLKQDVYEKVLNLESDLQQFCGTENYYRNFTGLLYTDGVKYLADNAGAHWLIDLIGSYQPKLKNIPFQLWSIDKRQDSSAGVYCQEDIGEPLLVKQEIEWTDFPLNEFKLYCVDNVLLLPSEY